MSTFNIVRFYQSDKKAEVLLTGLSREDATAYCNDIETSSNTCQEKNNVEHTQLFGHWFDGFNEE